MLLVLWDVDGTLVRTAGHGRYAFEEAFETVVGRTPEPVDYAGRTDKQIALMMLAGDDQHLERVLEELEGALELRKEAMRAAAPSQSWGSAASASRNPASVVAVRVTWAPSKRAYICTSRA